MTNRFEICGLHRQTAHLMKSKVHFDELYEFICSHRPGANDPWTWERILDYLDSNVLSDSDKMDDEDTVVGYGTGVIVIICREKLSGEAMTKNQRASWFNWVLG